jgi:hypothetical protein
MPRAASNADFEIIEEPVRREPVPVTELEITEPVPGRRVLEAMDPGYPNPPMIYGGIGYPGAGVGMGMPRREVSVGNDTYFYDVQAGLYFDQPTMGSPVTCGAERVQLYSYRQETAYPEHMHEDWQRSLRIVQEIQDNMTRYSCDTTDKLGYYQRRAIRNAPGVTCPDMERRVQGLNHRMQMTVEDARLHMASELGVDAFSRAIEGKTEDERIAIYLNFDRGSVSFGMYDVYQSQLERVMNELRQPPCSILSNDMVEIDTERAAQLSRCERLSHEMDSARYQADELDPSRVPARVRELEDQLDACFDAAASGEGTAWGSGQWGAGPIPRPGASQTR